MNRSRSSSDVGSATIWVLTLTAMVMFVGATVMVAGLSLYARHRAEVAADLAALAGAQQIGITDDACRQAAVIARDNAASLAECSVTLDPSGRSGVVAVQVRRTINLPLIGHRIAQARAKAGRLAPTSADGVQYQAKHDQRRLLVQRVVAVAAFGRLHAGRAAGPALAGCDRGPGRRQPLGQNGVAASGEPGPAGMPVIDEHGGPSGVGMQRGGNPADVPSVAGGEQRQQADSGVFGRMRAPGNISRPGRRRRSGRVEGVPDGRGQLPLTGRSSSISSRARRRTATLVADHLMGHLDRTEMDADTVEQCRVSPGSNDLRYR